MNARASVGAITLALVVVLSGCSAGEVRPSTPSPAASDPVATSTPSLSPTPAATPTATAVKLPTDCRALLSDDVLAQMGDVPLNDDAFGPSGVGADGSLTCIWRDPRADTSGLTTTITTMSRGPALDMLNALAADQGFACFAPDRGTRCEKTWQNEQYPVTDGRTLFWRDGILIDTSYSNFAPSGYTASIVEHLFE